MTDYCSTFLQKLLTPSDNDEFVALTLLLYTASQKRISKIPTFLGVTRANIELSLYLAKNITEKFSNQRLVYFSTSPK